MPTNPIHPEPELNTWHTSEFYTSINGGKMVGNASMPDFVGCGAGAEDLSALISGMSSSPENKTIQRQSGTMSCWGWYLFYPCDDHEVPLPTRPCSTCLGPRDRAIGPVARRTSTPALPHLQLPSRHHDPDPVPPDYTKKKAWQAT